MVKKRKLYIASVIVLALGFLITTVYIVKGYSALGSRLEDFQFPGSYNFRVEEAGEYLIYLDAGKSFSNLEGETMSPKEVAKMFDIEVTSLDSGKKLDVTIKDNPITYTYQERSGIALWDILLETPGMYSISAVRSDGGKEGFVLTLDRGVYKLRARTVVVAQTMALILFTVALILFVKGYSIKMD